ncbi:hypothetical protein BSZ37_12580 [Rubrivirga marina]|uniref:Uncharacterized protein n=1 Tax=Rubrivirga marina TaxID=1196024 RepID=A0A271J1M3_9BACT|nr:hypothetical protein BSZ37_12580 [Rubrivirga marina]
MPAWEVALKVTLGLVLLSVGGVHLVRQIRTRRYGADDNWGRYSLSMMALIAGFFGLGLIVSACG